MEEERGEKGGKGEGNGKRYGIGGGEGIFLTTFP